MRASRLFVNGKILYPGYITSAYIYPGIALAISLFKITRIDEKIFLLAAKVIINLFIIFFKGTIIIIFF